VDPTAEQFGNARLREALGGDRSGQLREGVAALLREIERERGAASAEDDLTLRAFEVSAEAGRDEPGVENQAGGNL
jgi:serine phosphatase RsbU (regulator of sigma subunit)